MEERTEWNRIKGENGITGRAEDKEQKARKGEEEKQERIKRREEHDSI